MDHGSQLTYALAPANIALLVLMGAITVMMALLITHRVTGRLFEMRHPSAR